MSFWFAKFQLLLGNWSIHRSVAFSGLFALQRWAGRMRVHAHQISTARCDLAAQVSARVACFY